MVNESQDEYLDDGKKPSVIKRVFKFLFFGVAAAVYLIFFVRFFVSCDADIADEMFLDAKTAAVFKNLDKDLPFYHYQPVSWTNEDASVQISYIYYIEKYENLQLTVRSRDDIFDKDSEVYPFSFKLRVKGEEEEELVLTPSKYVEKRYGYTYARLVSTGVICDMGEKVEVELETFDEDGNSVISTETEIKGGTQVWLDIYDSETGDLLHTFEVAGKNVNRARIRRFGIDVTEISAS